MVQICGMITYPSELRARGPRKVADKITNRAVCWVRKVANAVGCANSRLSGSGERVELHHLSVALTAGLGNASSNELHVCRIVWLISQRVWIITCKNVRLWPKAEVMRGMLTAEWTVAFLLERVDAYKSENLLL